MSTVESESQLGENEASIHFLDLKPQVDALSQSRSFREIACNLFGDVSKFLTTNLAFNLEATCFIESKHQWSEFRIRREVNQLLEEYGYDSLQDWDEHVYDNRLNTIYLSKKQVNEIIQERMDDMIQSMILEESKAIHSLFGVIVADNYSSLMKYTAFQALKDHDPETLKEQIQLLLKREARVQLRRNKFFSFQQWEDKINSQWS